ncbi:MAG: signal peptide peptidase SppA [Candidatus Marinimicrobia bacterium]|nr:signal peptide peptidase SppA [Candidatus Neomarinimicrobiota bacterium]MCF7830354.1 signal peptide peptidase SppA [Candidatus Neomarinimicrobiota bacterium]MCF7882450.1 signal peptide peptidase SppA [Candidatus Neomarinimicrobiota bacterium]
MAKRRSDIVVGVLLVLAVLFIFWAVFGMFQTPQTGQRMVSGSGEVAILEVEGMITDAYPFTRELNRYMDQKNVKAIVIRVESPGGIVAASQEMYDAIRRARNEDKPIVVSMGSLAASGGYYIALGADSILANPGTLTGSIGVLMDFPQTTKLLQSLGIEFHSVTSGPLKNAGSPYAEWDQATQEYFKSLVMNTYEQFVEAVAAERNLSNADVRALADGRVFTGEQALEYGLIDKIGGLYEAVQVAGEMAGITGEPTTFRPQSREIRVWDLLFGDLEEIVNRVVVQSPVPEYRY